VTEAKFPRPYVAGDADMPHVAVSCEPGRELRNTYASVKTVHLPVFSMHERLHEGALEGTWAWVKTKTGLVYTSLLELIYDKLERGRLRSIFHHYTVLALPV